MAPELGARLRGVFTRLLGIRPEDRRDTGVAFATLLGVMLGHSLLETARDTLFLSTLAASGLLWAYIAIAGLTLLVTAAARRGLSSESRRRMLAVTLLVGAGVTTGFWLLIDEQSPALLFSLYVWTGLLATTIVVQFWLLLAEVLDVGQAKRVFATIGAGGLVGAATGSVLSNALLMVLPPRALVLGAAFTFFLTAAAPPMFSKPRPTSGGRSRRTHLPRGSNLRLLRKEPYLRRVFWVLLTSTVLLTGVDYVFKAMVAVDVATDQLGVFFARFYLVMNVLALVVQLVLAPRLLRVLGVNGSLLMLPCILLAGSVGFVLTAGLGSALLLRAADGSLRHSLHRTATEILYLPLPPDIRDRFKSISEAIGQRGGQALASIALLAALSAGARPVHLGIGMVVMALLWLVTIYGLKPHYLELFRRNLREGSIETHVEVSDLDLHSFEALISALSSDNDYEVLGALDILASYGKTNLVPALILYHPSKDVVLRAFELFSDSKRTDVRRLTERLLKHESEEIRAAALRAHSAQEIDAPLLQSLASDESALVRTTATVQLIRAGVVAEFDGGDVLREIIDGDSPRMRMALAYAGRDLPSGRYSWALIRLAGVQEPGLTAEVARSMAAAPDPEFMPTLIRMLADRSVRDDARRAILALGDRALDALGEAMEDVSLPRRVQRHLPRTVSRFSGPRPIRMLLARLNAETDEAVQFKIVKGLAAVRAAAPTVRIDRGELLRYAKASLQRAVTLLHWRQSLEVVCQLRADYRTASAELLDALLADKEGAAVDRVFRVLQILDPIEEFSIIYSGLKADDRMARANGRELLANVVPDSLRAGLLALVDEAPDIERLRAAAAFFDPPGRAELEEQVDRLGAQGDEALVVASVLERLQVRCLRSMLIDPSEALSSVASFRIMEIGLEELKGELLGGVQLRGGALAQLAEQARSVVEHSRPEPSSAE